MSSRDEILGKLRGTLARTELRFPPADPAPLTAETRLTVTRAEGGPLELARRFGEELVKLYGVFTIVETPAEARLTLVNRILDWMEQDAAGRKGVQLGSGQESSVLAWDPELLPVEGLAPALQDIGLNLVAPSELQSAEIRDEVRYIRYGVSGVEAAFASTGTMLMASAAGASRAVSLLPFYHAALIPFSRLYPTVEAWLASRRAAGELEAYVRSHANLTLITGPSKSADIEMNLTLGVHGPRFVHAILFDDSPRAWTASQRWQAEE